VRLSAVAAIKEISIECGACVTNAVLCGSVRNVQILNQTDFESAASASSAIPAHLQITGHVYPE
jgi:hypothetical protein